MNLFFQSLARSYGRALKNAGIGLYKNYVIIIGSILLLFIAMLSIRLLAPLFGGLAGGFIAGLIFIALLSIYYCWIESTIKQEKLAFKDLILFDYNMFVAVLNVAFILYVVDLLASLITKNPDMSWLGTCVSLFIVIIFNPVPEVIIVNRDEGASALAYAFKFTMKRWIEWFIPIIILLIPTMVMSSPMHALFLLASSHPLLPSITLANPIAFAGGINVSAFVSFIVFALVVNYLILFRCFLFKELDRR